MPPRSFRCWPLLLLLAACTRTPRPSVDLDNKYHDAVNRQIGTAQDERNTAALLPFLTNSNPIYRREAALAFASVQAPAAVPGLVPLLRDGDYSVRRAAAYALGQIGDSTAVDSLLVRVQAASNSSNGQQRKERWGIGGESMAGPDLVWPGQSGAPSTESIAHPSTAPRRPLRLLLPAAPRRA